MPEFRIGEHDFLLDGRPFRILSGAIHYFRVHPDDWKDRIHKARLMGLNTVETYVAWNAHEPHRGEWDGTGWNDLGRFLDLVAAEGMQAIVRPGPYICAEWHNGGLPVWLTSYPQVRLRSSDPRYMDAVLAFLERVYDIVVPRQIDRGGPVILVQIENEYGAYGDDASYLAALVRTTREAGVTVPLTTVDQPVPEMLEAGRVEGAHLTGSFGSRATQRLATLREHQPTGPLMCSEFWDGWFDWWGGVHHTTTPEDSAAELDALLSAGASVNFYMFHGGTNFGLTNGANHKGRYLPLTTSYDYSAPLDETGAPTEKFWAFREVLSRHVSVPAEQPVSRTVIAVPDVELSSHGDWLQLVPRRDEEFATPPTFDDLECLDALVVYETSLPHSERARSLDLGGVRDLAWVEVDEVPVGSLSRMRHERSLTLPPGERLRLVVEDQGRVNYGPRLGENKGLMSPVTVGGAPTGGWRATPVDVEELARWVAAGETTAATASGRAAMRGTFMLPAQSDLFLDTTGWGKGYAFVNELFLGRYWSNGPQRTLYVPGAATRQGENVLVVIELASGARTHAHFVATADLGPVEE